MIPSNPVPQVCDYGTSAVYCSCPDEEQIRAGVVPLDSLPAAWWNWMWSKTNQAVNCARYAAGVLIDEVNTVLQQAGVCVCDTCVNQLYTAINNIRQTIGDSVTAGAVKSSSTCGQVSIDAQGIMTANGLGNAALLATSATNVVAAVNELKTTYDGCWAANVTALGGKAPTAHASSATTYGVGSSSNYGHLKISDQYTSVLAACSGVAASQKAVACTYAAIGTCATTLQTNIDGKAPTAHASSATTYGVGSSSNYGHLKISDQYTSVLAACSGVAASQKALACVYNSIETIAAQVAPLANTNGCALGTAAPGTATTVSRSDHVHPKPTFVVCACKAYHTMAIGNADRNLLLGEASEAAGYGCTYVGNCCKVTFNPSTGVLKAKCFCGTASCADHATAADSASSAGSANTATSAGSATNACTAKCVVDKYGSGTYIGIGYAGAGLTCAQLTHFAAFSTNYTSGCTVIKDASIAVVQQALGLGSAAYANLDTMTVARALAAGCADKACLASIASCAAMGIADFPVLGIGDQAHNGLVCSVCICKGWKRIYMSFNQCSNLSCGQWLCNMSRCLNALFKEQGYFPDTYNQYRCFVGLVPMLGQIFFRATSISDIQIRSVQGYRGCTDIYCNEGGCIYFLDSGQEPIYIHCIMSYFDVPDVDCISGPFWGEVA